MLLVWRTDRINRTSHQLWLTNHNEAKSFLKPPCAASGASKVLITCRFNHKIFGCHFWLPLIYYRLYHVGQSFLTAARKGCSAVKIITTGLRFLEKHPVSTLVVSHCIIIKKIQLGFFVQSWKEVRNNSYIFVSFSCDNTCSVGYF